MALISKSGALQDRFERVADDAALPESGAVLLSLARFLDTDTSAHPRVEFGVIIEPEEDPASLQGHLPKLGVIAIHFPKFADGRGYSYARLLRERYGWDGELRAIGQVLRDQLFYYARCGFDTFDLLDGKSVESALAAFAEFSVRYQTAADKAPPIYRQR